MAYKLNKTDGTLLTELVDGQIDTTSSDITLIGRNYVGFGEAFNENLIKILENFASTAAPATPITGQLWYDKSQGRLKVYDGTGFKSNGPIVSNTQPQMVAGDIWINNATNQMKFFDGTGDPVLVGPIYTDAQGKSGFEVDTVRDKSSVDHTLIKLFIGETTVALISNDEYSPTLAEQSRLNYTQDIKRGFNIIDADNFRFYGVADSSNSLITDQIDPDTQLRIRKTAGQFLASDANSITTGTIFIQNSGGLTVGQSGEAKFQATDELTSIELTGKDDRFRINLLGSTEYDGFVLTSNNRRAGINMDLGQLPTATLDINGDALIRGNLTIEGSSTTIETQNLTVDDYNIELGHADTVITLNAALDATIAGQFAVGETVTQSSTSATGTFKSISSDLVTLTLEPTNGTFSSGADTLTGSAVGLLNQEGGANAVVSSVVQRSDSTANNAGVIIKGAPSNVNANDKYLKWLNDGTEGDNWQVSDHLNLYDGKAYKINNVVIAQENSGGTFHELGSAIEVAAGLREVGQMDRVRIKSSMEIRDSGGTPIIDTTAGLQVNSGGTVVFNNVKITGVATTNYATGATTDVANKDYVDTQMESDTIALIIDVTDMPQTGFASLDAQVIDSINFLHPASEKRINTYARVITTSLRGAVSNIAIGSSISTTKIGVDFSDLNVIEPYGATPTAAGPANQQLVQDIGFTGTTTGDVTLKADDGATPTANTTRVKRFFKVEDVGGTKTWVTSATGPNGETP
jgi:hypothetical protein